MHRRREIILAKVFFSDSPDCKIRPAIVLSHDKYNSGGFLLVSAITTALDEYCIPIPKEDATCPLDEYSGARFDGIIKVHRKQAIRGIGRISAKFHEKLVGKIVQMVER